MANKFFANDLSGKKKEALEEVTSGLIDLGFDEARTALTYVQLIFLPDCLFHRVC